MAVTKIHPIKTTLNLSIDYICNPDKTDDEILISSYKCGYKTAAIEFNKTKDIKNSSSKNLARHLIQSFMPGEVTPETAHQIGRELCEKHLHGKHEYVLTTHIDRGHIHNHIIFNNVSFIDGKAYISNKRSYHQIRTTSDELCMNNGLSIATETPISQSRNKIKGTSYKEYQERKHGNSYKAKLQYAIDAAIRSARDWNDFLWTLQERGYAIKHGKHISFRAIGQERFTRSKTIGEDYTEERIKERIESGLSNRQVIQSSKGHSISKVIDLSTNQLARESVGFARWLKLQNLKVMASSWNMITNNDINDLDSFYVHVDTVHDKLGEKQNEIKTIELAIHESKNRIQDIETFNLYSNIYDRYLSSGDKENFFQSHERELISFEAARESLGKSLSSEVHTSLPKLKEHIYNLDTKLQVHMKELSALKKEISEVNQLCSNLDIYLQSKGISRNDRSATRHDNRV